MKNKIFVMLLLGLVVVNPSVWAAPTDKDIADLKSEIADLKKGQQETQKSLEEIKKLLERGARPSAPQAPAFEEQVVEFAGAPYLGDSDAALTLVEFSDYQCPFCARHFRSVMPRLEEEYVNTGKVKMVMLENPLTAIHRDAFAASMAALCAHDEGKYWEMHDMMFENQKQLGSSNLTSYAEAIGLNMDAYQSCMDSRKYEDAVNEHLALASKVGVNGTPGFLLGITDPDNPDQALMKVYIKGAQAFPNFQARIESMLKEVE